MDISQISELLVWFLGFVITGSVTYAALKVKLKELEMKSIELSQQIAELKSKSNLMDNHLDKLKDDIHQILIAIKGIETAMKMKNDT